MLSVRLDEMTTVGFLHTSPAHVVPFELLVAELGGDSVTTVAAVDAPLLELARSTGGPDVVRGVDTHLRALRDRGATVVICTCSTIGGVAEEVGTSLGMDVRRVDRAMAERAVDIGGRIVVLAALESTLGPTTELLRSVADGRGRPEPDLDVRLVDGAWARFEAEDLDGYHDLVAETILGLADEADVIVLAQASMAEAARRVDPGVPVLSSPRLAVEAALS